LLFGAGDGALRYRPIVVDVRQLLDDVISEMPTIEASRIRREDEIDRSRICGDPWQLAWISQTVFAHLLRFAPPKTDVVCRLVGRGAFLRIRFEGCYHQGNELYEYGSKKDLEIERAVVDLSLATPTLERFVKNHRGSLIGPAAEAGRLTFDIDFPRQNEGPV
jgi:hypothetical protein